MASWHRLSLWIPICSFVHLPTHSFRMWPGILKQVRPEIMISPVWSAQTLEWNLAGFWSPVNVGRTVWKPANLSTMCFICLYVPSLLWCGAMCLSKFWKEETNSDSTFLALSRLSLVSKQIHCFPIMWTPKGHVNNEEKGFQGKTMFKFHTEFGEWTLPNDLSSSNFSLLVWKME